MLRYLTVANWKSVYSPVEFSMVATNERRHGERLARVGRSRVLPVAALSIGYVAGLARITRGAMIEVLNSPYIRTARAKGLSMNSIVLRHALRPAMLPILSYLVPAFVGIITGAIVIESVFGLPGIGQLFVNGALNRDYGMILGLTILVGVLTIVFNAILDILYALIDPKIRY